MVSILKTDKIQASHGSTIEIPSGHVLSQPGSVIQVVTGPGNVARMASTSTSYVDTPVTATITPKLATSKILVRFNTVVGTSSNVYAYLRLMRNIGGGSFSLVNANEDDTVIDGYGGSWTMIGHEALDSPATTSACIYKIQSKAASGTHYVGFTTDADNKNMMNMTLMEIAQ